MLRVGSDVCFQKRKLSAMRNALSGALSLRLLIIEPRIGSSSLPSPYKTYKTLGLAVQPLESLKRRSKCATLLP